MKTLSFVIVFVVCVVSVHANSPYFERNKIWLVDSYHYGKRGKPCNNIYFNYGTDTWTFSSDDPGLLKDLFEACTAGDGDRLKGGNSLPDLLDTFQMKYGK